MCCIVPYQALAEASAERDQRQRELTANAGRSAALHQDISRLEQHLDACQRWVFLFICWLTQVAAGDV